MPIQQYKASLPDNSNLYTGLDYAYTGSGPYETGSILTRHERESDAGYIRRANSVVYPNYFKSLIDVQINAIFAKAPSRVYNEDSQFELFIKNADGRNSLTALMRKAAQSAKTLGTAWLLLENSDTGADNLQEAITKRLIPYVLHIKPQYIVDFKLDYLGNFIEFTYKETFIDADNEKDYELTTWTVDTVTIYSSEGAILKQSENALGLIPLTVLVSSGMDIEEGSIPYPEYQNIKQLNDSIVNIHSLVLDGIYQQGFSILCVTGELGTKEQPIQLGTTNAINWNPAGMENLDKPEFISPDSTPIDTMLDYMAVLKEQIQEQSISNFKSANSDNQSGIAKRIDNLNRSESLENLARGLESSEEKLALLFGLYIGLELDYSVQYDKDYDIDDVAQSIVDAQAMLDIGWSSRDVTEATREKLIRKYFSDEEPEYIDVLVNAESDASNEEASQPVPEPSPDVIEPV